MVVRVLCLTLLVLPMRPAGADPGSCLAAAARRQVGVVRHYDPAYQRLAYPGGDVAADRGVCTDVVVRAYRQFGIDLQQRVHEDMRAHFGDYPRRWGLDRPDRNIDHRRVPNLNTWFARHGASLPASGDATDYRAGDLVSWTLPGGLPHIGIVSDRAGADGVPLVLHNIGAGVQEEDVLFAYPTSAHQRYLAGVPGDCGGPR